MSSGDQTPYRTGSRLPWPIMAVIGFGLLAIIAGVWAVRSHNEVESLKQELTELRASANASVFILQPTDHAPAAVQGQVFINLSGTGIVVVSNLPQSGDNEEFRLWYLAEDDTAVSGGTLHVDAHGQGFALIPGDTGTYSRIAISLESTDNDTPDGVFLLIGEVRSGRG